MKHRFVVTVRVLSEYSSVPNKGAGPKRGAGWNCPVRLHSKICKGAEISVQVGIFSQNQ